MKHLFRKLILLGGIFLLVTTACRVGIPDTQCVVLSEKRTLVINESLPQDIDQPMEVEIVMGAGNLKISGGSDQLLEGTVEYNVVDWEPEVERKERSLEIRQGVERSVDLKALDRVVNRWELQMGGAPVGLRITAGAYDGEIDLSGVPITDLDISDGASDVDLVFEQPNPVEMDRFSYRTGASDVNIKGLGYANFRRMDFDGGAGSFTLDFSGALQRDCWVKIDGGLGDFKIIIPEETAAEVEFNGELMDINTRGTWTVHDNVYSSGGSGPLLEIEINIGLGSVTLVSE
ncbi:MAG: toast rack family protein [Anaerolineaceae bacterium]|nr:toast rack family protein [Anaerolineaceae bacterium]